MSVKKNLKIFFIDGNAMEFTFQPTIDPSMIGAALNDIMTQSNLILEAEGRLFVFPTANIKYLTVNPSPERLSATIVRGAKLVV